MGFVFIIGIRSSAPVTIATHGVGVAGGVGALGQFWRSVGRRWGGAVDLRNEPRFGHAGGFRLLRIFQEQCALLNEFAGGAVKGESGVDEFQPVVERRALEFGGVGGGLACKGGA